MREGAGRRGGEQLFFFFNLTLHPSSPLLLFFFLPVFRTVISHSAGRGFLKEASQKLKQNKGGRRKNSLECDFLDSPSCWLAVCPLYRRPHSLIFINR